MCLPALGLADSHGTLRVHKHMHAHESLEQQHDPSACPEPLPGPQPSDPSHRSSTHQLVQLDTPDTQHSHSSQGHSMFAGTPSYQHGLLTYLIVLPKPEASCLPAGPALSLQVDTCTCPMHQLVRVMR